MTSSPIGNKDSSFPGSAPLEIARSLTAAGIPEKIAHIAAYETLLQASRKFQGTYVRLSRPTLAPNPFTLSLLNGLIDSLSNNGIEAKQAKASGNQSVSHLRKLMGGEDWMISR
ncbi:hypothetical protein [Crenothrix sp.]|uniref:hypothetical protein n=1 Tax=Crenothrix sp. TaxID=3100433 RepID=UPI00374CAAB4